MRTCTVQYSRSLAGCINTEAIERKERSVMLPSADSVGKLVALPYRETLQRWNDDELRYSVSLLLLYSIGRELRGVGPP